MGVAALTTTGEAAILTRALAPSDGIWSADVAKVIAAIGHAPSDTQRMDELAVKARSGELGPDEDVEIESYRQACRLLECMRAKARASLARTVTSAR